MPTSGLVITAHHVADVPAILAELAAHASVEAAAPVGARIPLVTETADKTADKVVWDWLWTVPGVAMVDVAFIHLDQPGDPPPRGRSELEPTATSAPAVSPSP